MVTPAAGLARRTCHLAYIQPCNAFAEEHQTCPCRNPEDGSKPVSASIQVSPGGKVNSSHCLVSKRKMSSERRGAGDKES